MEAAVRVRVPPEPLRRGQSAVRPLGRRKHPTPAQTTQRRHNLVVNLQDRQIEASPILGHWHVNVPFVDVLPFKRQCLGFSQTCEQKQLLERLVYGIVKRFYLLPPLAEVIDDRAVRRFFVPLDRHRRTLRQIIGAPGMVPDRSQHAQCPVGADRMG